MNLLDITGFAFILAFTVVGGCLAWIVGEMVWTALRGPRIDGEGFSEDDHA